MKAWTAAWLLCLCALYCAECSTKVPVEVVYKGRRFNVAATDVAEVQQHLQRQSGVVPAQQAVLHKGRILKPDDALAQAGVKPGDTLNVIPTRVKPSPVADASAATPTSAAANASTATGTNPAADLLGAFASNPAMEAQLMAMLRSPVVKQLLQDDSKLEMLRQQLTADPQLLKSIEPMTPPEFKAAIHDPNLWKQQMAIVREQWDDIVQIAEEQLRQSPPPSASNDTQKHNNGTGGHQLGSANESDQEEDEFE